MVTATTEGLATLSNVQVFHPLRVEDQDYTETDLKNMALNWAEFQDRMEPPVVLGHEESQTLTAHMGNTGIPAVGWVKRMEFGEGKDRGERTRPMLLTDLHEVHPEVANAVNLRGYKKVSIEPWRRPPEQVFDNRGHILSVLAKRGIDPAAALAEAEAWAPGEHAKMSAAHEAGKVAKVPSRDWLVDYKLRDKLGAMVRRLALLGGEVPRLGGLYDLPEAVFSSRRRDGLHTDELYEAFMDTATADAPVADAADSPAPGKGAAKRAKLEDVLRRAGWPDSLITALDALPHSAMNDFVLAALEHAAGTGPDAAPADPAVAAEEAAEAPADQVAEDAGTPTPEQMIADLVALGGNEAELKNLDPAALYQLWTQSKGKKMSAPAPRSAATPPPDAAFAARIADIDRRLAETERLTAARLKAVAAQELAARARQVDQLLEQLNSGREPRITPGEIPRLRRQLLAADNSRVQKFGDKECTEFEDLVDGLNERVPLTRFSGERARQGGANDGVDSEVTDYLKRRAPKRVG